MTRVGLLDSTSFDFLPVHTWPLCTLTRVAKQQHIDLRLVKPGASVMYDMTLAAWFASSLYGAGPGPGSSQYRQNLCSSH